MGVAVLPPQDCLSRHHHHRSLMTLTHKPSRRNPNANSNPNPTPSPNSNGSRRRRRNSPPPPPFSMPTKSQSPANLPPLMGQIRILKRGEDLAPPTKPMEEQEVFTQTEPQPQPQPQPEPARVPDGFYAGSAFVTSPPPSSLPLPAFFTKRNCGLSEAHNQEIASELRRVLKLN